MKLLLSAIGLLAIVAYAAWAYWFTSTGINLIQCDNAISAEGKASVHAIVEGRQDLQVIRYTGRSNTTWGAEIINGFILVDEEFPFDELTIRDFAVYRHSGVGLVAHAVAGFTDDGIVMEGDGNNAQDSELMTEDNYVGLIYQKTVWSY